MRCQTPIFSCKAENLPDAGVFAGKLLPSYSLPNHRFADRRGVALVLVLSALILLTFLLVAFFSQAVTNRRVATYQNASTNAAMVADAAAELVLSDLLLEWEEGAGDPENEDDRWRRPSSPARMVVESTAPGSIPGLLKMSRRDTPFFTFADEAPDRASSVSTASTPRNGSPVVRERWNAPRLIPPTLFEDAFVEPDWVLLTKGGPRSFSDFQEGLRDRESADFVIGRYAYAVYDVGGLVDVNAMGNDLAAEENRMRGRLHRVNDWSPVGLSSEALAELIDWRWDIADDPSVLDLPERDFIEVLSGDQAMLGRQDLLMFAERRWSAEDQAALPFLTTFSRTLNAPSYRPDPDRPASPEGREIDDEINPDLLAVRRPEAVTLQPGTEEEIELDAGTPVVFRRFPLERLNLLSSPDADAADLLYFFGLERNADGYSFDYVQADPNGLIYTLEEIAELNPPREANFFELLQAIILVGSLGKTGGDTITPNVNFDSNTEDQIIQIGANIIDQWDEDDLPTTINFAIGDQARTFYGVENLPYIQMYSDHRYRPEWDPDLMQTWAIFTVWNPHQNFRPPRQEDISQFRIIPTSGRVTRFRTHMTGNLLGLQNVFSNNELTVDLVVDPSDVTTLGSDSEENEILFPRDGDYREPVMLTGENPPTDAEDRSPGILLSEVEVPPFIPIKEERSPEVQGNLNEAHDQHAPYSTNPEEPSRFVDSDGNRVYFWEEGDPPVEINIPGDYSDLWVVERDDSARTVTVYAEYAPKAHNMAHISTVSDLSFELQIEVPGQGWRTIQRIEGHRSFSPSRADSTFNISGLSQNPEAYRAMARIPTHHSGKDPDEDWETWATQVRNYYNWNSTAGGSWWNRTGFWLTDPRSRRFGVAWQRSGRHGFSVRNVADAAPTGFSDSATTWAVSYRFVIGSQNDQNGPALPGWYFRDRIGDDGSHMMATLGGLVANRPNPDGTGGGGLPGENDLTDARSPFLYADDDGVFRWGDGAYGSLEENDALGVMDAKPTVPGHFASRPRILNRPFRNVGELGYVFRDSPWKTFDFFTPNSADAGLLDVFTLDEAELVGGRVDLNRARAEVLGALLTGAARQIGNTGSEPVVAASDLSEAQASALAERLFEAVQDEPMESLAGLVTQFTDEGEPDSPFNFSPIKTEREAAIRALSGVGQVRTWNLMFDIIAQAGRYPPGAQNLSEFAVAAERRIWLHVAIDRFSGEILDTRLEVVHE